MTVPHRTRPVPAFLDFRRRSLPPGVVRQVHLVPPGGRLDCSPAPWNDALAVLESGCVDLRVTSGAGLHLCPGAIFNLRGLTPAVLTPTEPGSAVISTLSRCPEGEAP